MIFKVESFDPSLTSISSQFSWFEHFAKLFDDRIDEYYVMSNYYENNEDYEQCLYYVDKMIELEPHRFHYALKSYYYAKLDRIKDCKKYYELAMKAQRDELVFDYYELETMIDIFNYLRLPRYVQNDYYKDFYPSLKTNERIYFDLALQATDSRNKALADRLLRIKEYEDSPRMAEFKIKYYLTYAKYEEGLEYLKSIDEDFYRNYDEAWIVFNYYLKNYEEVIKYKNESMENGISAFFTYMSLGLLEREEEAAQYLNEFEEYAKEHDVRHLEFFINILGDFLDEISE